jgi:ankyrin repeat protein
MKAAFEGMERAVTVLLDHSPSPRVQDCMLRTALHHAASEGHVGVARRLLKADSTIPSWRDQQNFSALDQAVHRNKEQFAELLLDESSKAGTHSLADLKCDSGETPLMCAVREGLAKLLRISWREVPGTSLEL